MGSTREFRRTQSTDDTKRKDTAKPGTSDFTEMLQTALSHGKKCWLHGSKVPQVGAVTIQHRRWLCRYYSSTPFSAYACVRLLILFIFSFVRCVRPRA